MKKPENYEPSIIKIIKRNSLPMEPIPTSANPRVAMIPDIHAVVFDIYGTLFISSSGDIGTTAATSRATAVQKAFSNSMDIHMPDEEAEQILDSFHSAILKHHKKKHESGITFPEVNILDIWKEVVRVNPVYEQLVNLAVEFETLSNHVWPMTGALSLLRRFSKSKLLLGIISNAQFYTPFLFPALLKSSMSELGFSNDRCVWSWRTGESKPSAVLFDLCIDKLRRDGIVSPEHILYVGNDMLNDIYGAAKAGMRTALFAGDRRSMRMREEDPVCKGTVPDVLITNLEQLNQVVGIT